MHTYVWELDIHEKVRDPVYMTGSKADGENELCDILS